VTRSYDGHADDFLAAFDALIQAVRRARGTPAGQRDSGLTLSQYALLQPLAERERVRVTELAEHAAVAASTATRILDALERRGLVARAPAPDDRRGVTVALTPAGREAVLSEHEWLRSRERDFYALLPARERALAPDLLGRLAALIDELALGPVR
jgi:DNA-binding MarR family transcriptional regulator